MKRTMRALSASAIALSVGIAAGSVVAPKANAVDITNNIGLGFIFETTYFGWNP